MQYRKKLMAVLLCVLSVLSFTACNKEPEFEENVVYEFGGTNVTYGEYYIYAKTVEEDYQQAYGNGVWTLELNTNEGKDTLKDVTIRDIISSINRVKVLVSKAESMKISLSEKEKAEAENIAETFYKGLTEEDRAETEITKALVVQVVEENIIAEQVYKKVLSEHEFEISEEEARMTTFYDMVFECYKVKKDGTVQEYSDEKKEKQLEKANEALLTLAEEEDSSYELIVDQYNLEYSSAYTMSRTGLIEEYGESIADKILALSDGEISAVIKSEYGYHIFKMLEAKDEELTKKNKEDIVTKQQKEYFATVYEDWLKRYDSHFDMDEVNMKLVNRFPFSEEK